LKGQDPRLPFSAANELKINLLSRTEHTRRSQLTHYSHGDVVSTSARVSRLKIAVWVSKGKLLVLILVSHSWSWQSVADLGVVRSVSVLNLKLHLRKLIHITITRYSKLIGRTAKRCNNSTSQLTNTGTVGLGLDHGLEFLVLVLRLWSCLHR